MVRFPGVSPQQNLRAAIKRNFTGQDLHSSWFTSNLELRNQDFSRSFSFAGSQDTYSTSLDGMESSEGPYLSEMKSPSASDSHFLDGLMPKEGIGALRFLEEHPHFDGRGVTVAIFGEL